MDKSSKGGKAEPQPAHTHSEAKDTGPSAGHNPAPHEGVANADRGATPAPATGAGVAPAERQASTSHGALPQHPGDLQPGQVATAPHQQAPYVPQQGGQLHVANQPQGALWQPQGQGHPQPPKPDTLTGRAQRMGLAPDWLGPIVSQLGPIAGQLIITLIEKLMAAQGRAESAGKGVAHSHPKGEHLPADLQQKIDELAHAAMEHAHGGK